MASFHDPWFEKGEKTMKRAKKQSKKERAWQIMLQKSKPIQWEIYTQICTCIDIDIIGIAWDVYENESKLLPNMGLAYGNGRSICELREPYLFIDHIIWFLI